MNNHLAARYSSLGWSEISEGGAYLATDPVGAFLLQMKGETPLVMQIVEADTGDEVLVCSYAAVPSAMSLLENYYSPEDLALLLGATAPAKS